MQYVRLPPPRETLPYEKIIAVLLVTAFSIGIVALARGYHRPMPPPSHVRTMNHVL